MADDAFEDALESPPMPPSASAPLEVPPPKWEVGPATPTPVETHQLRLTPARVSRASQKVAGARSLRDDPGSYEAQWLASAKKSSNRKSILKSSSRYRPPSPSREAEAGAEAEAECASAHADDAFHSPASAAAEMEDEVPEEEEEGDSTLMVAEKGADAMAAILAADDTLTIGTAAAMVPGATLTDALTLANTPSKLPRSASKTAGATPRRITTPAAEDAAAAARRRRWRPFLPSSRSTSRSSRRRSKRGRRPSSSRRCTRCWGPRASRSAPSSCTSASTRHQAVPPPGREGAEGAAGSAAAPST